MILAKCIVYNTYTELTLIIIILDYSTLLINGHPFKTNFGGFPMVISVNGNKHFVKLNLPPEGVYISNITPPPIRQNQGNKGLLLYSIFLYRSSSTKYFVRLSEQLR